MIFVTVGTQGPFDRLVRVVDEWAGRTGRTDVVAQIGDSSFEPEHLDWSHHLDPADFETHLRSADLVVAHAGMGTILAALEHRTPLIVMPRRVVHGEHRNDHQLSTCARLAEMGRLVVADDAEMLAKMLDRVEETASPPELPSDGSHELQHRIRARLDEWGVRRVLALSSGGGHWAQLRRTAAAYDGLEVAWATVDGGYRQAVDGDAFHVVPDVSRWSSKRALVGTGAVVASVLLRTRPDVVITTGAAPGYMAVRLARTARRHTIWLDSLANAHEVSLSGRMAGPWSELWLTQWPDLASPGGPEYLGAVV